MKKGDIIELKIDKVQFPNKGIGQFEDKKVIVKNAIEGQKVKAVINKKRRNKIEGKLLEISERAEYEKGQICEHFGVCGGCLYQTMPYNMQIETKTKQVKEILDSFIEEEYEFLETIQSPKQTEYRNKMEFTFGDEVKDGPLALGMHQRGKFYEIVTTYDCQIVDEDFRKILCQILRYFQGNNMSFYHKKNHTGFLRHLVIRKTSKTGEILINLVTSSQSKLDEQKFTDRLMKIELKGKLKGIIHTINDCVADTVQPDEVNVLYGQNIITEELLGLKFNISAFSFFQTNSLGAEKLYSVIRDFAGDTKDKTIFDLYSGTGTIAQILAPIAKKVIGIEIVEEAVKKARENAELNNLNNCEFIAGDVLKKVDELKDKPDIIILDPPRVGIHQKAINKIIDFNPEVFIYVSCKPTSLKKDIPIFLERGYKVEKVQCIDMFPHTTHVEVVVRIQRKESMK